MVGRELEDRNRWLIMIVPTREKLNPQHGPQSNLIGVSLMLLDRWKRWTGVEDGTVKVHHIVDPVLVVGKW